MHSGLGKDPLHILNRFRLLPTSSQQFWGILTYIKPKQGLTNRASSQVEPLSFQQFGRIPTQLRVSNCQLGKIFWLTEDLKPSELQHV